MTDEPGAIWIPTNNFFPAEQAKRYVIIHGTAGGSSAQGTGNYFVSTEGTNEPASTNYVVGQNGEVVQCVAEANGPYANGVITGTPGNSGNGVGNGNHDRWWGDTNPNHITISVEHVKSSTDNSDNLTERQKQASFRLINNICNRHGIPKRPADSKGGITGHFSIDPINRQYCPGPYPWGELYAFLGGNMSKVPIGWVDDTKNKVLTAPNGFPVVLGFRDHILADSNWHSDNFPLEKEHNNQQLFRYFELLYSPITGIQLGDIGEELLKLRAQAQPVPNLTTEVVTAIEGAAHSIMLFCQDALKGIKP